MVGIEDKRAFCVLDYHVHQSVVAVQRHFRTIFGDPSIRKWYSDFKTRGCICKRKTSGRPSLSEQILIRICEFTHSPQWSSH
ncbi:hypothetical protein C0J52_09197 [Blattella germanica]|nr:hypothetical protein C0J52_09197 [Blattella germanica]PSN53558.1 hypothetical protein C0J52_09197 [Blattella germanica]PSN53559.1 hypothetical protein C0J52_09197 [Blattella germanica]